VALTLYESKRSKEKIIDDNNETNLSLGRSQQCKAIRWLCRGLCVGCPPRCLNTSGISGTAFKHVGTNTRAHATLVRDFGTVTWYIKKKWLGGHRRLPNFKY